MIGSNGGAHEHVYPNTIEGVVEAVNDKGIRIDGEWLNVSKFRPVELPDVGVVVRVRVQPKGFINGLEIIKGLEVLDGKSVSVTDLRPDSGHKSLTVSDSRDQRITRLAVLKAAAAFGASRADLKSADVLKIADSWLAWVEQ